MFEIYVEIALKLMLLAAVPLPIQLFLCLKVKSLFLRILPVIVFGAVGGMFFLLSFDDPGLYGLGYMVLAIYAAMMLIGCALGWGVWALWLRCGKGRKE